MEAKPTTIQVLTLLAALAGPLTTFFTARWLAKRSERTRLILSIHWKWFGPGERITEAAFLHLENRSAHTIFVNEVRLYWGPVFRRRRYSYTALWMEDPDDVNFPYEIEPGKSRSLMLDEDDPITIYRKLQPRYEWLFRTIKRFPVRIVVETTEGRRSSISALEAVKWSSRPKWSKSDA